MEFIWSESWSSENLRRRVAKRLWCLSIHAREYGILLKIGYDDEWYADFEKSGKSVWQHLPGVTSLEEAKAAVEMMARMEA